MDTVETILVGGGVAALLAAAAGGGLKAFGVEIAGMTSVRRQLLVATVGAGLLATGILLPDAPGKEGREESKPRVRPVSETFTMSIDQPMVVKEGLVFCFWNVTPYHAAGGVPPDMPTPYQEAYRDLKAKIGVFREGEPGRTCVEMGDHYRPPLRLGQSFRASHPECRLNVLVKGIKRTLKPPHTWEEFLEVGRTGRDRSDWLEDSVDLKLSGECPSP
jgi:hypothetical protein